MLISNGATFVEAGTCLDAPMIGVGAAGLAGRVTLCDDGWGMRVTVQVIDLLPGEVYTVWLGYRAIPASCHDGL